MKIEAMLLLGPTGSGKTPLGQALEKAGWKRRHCLHFDFGARLREADEHPDRVPDFTDEERGVVRTVLREGALLEDGQFSIAVKILADFLRRRGALPEDFLILNGLPRHAGQARDIEGLADVVLVVVLSAPPRTIRERIATDAAGDRLERKDDSSEDVERKLALFETRTRPLVDYYRESGIRVIRLDVGPRTSAEDLLQALLKAEDLIRRERDG